MCARRSRLALCLHLPLQDAGLHPLHFIAWLCCVQRVCSLHPALSTASCIPGCAAAGGLILACLCNSALTAIPNSLRRAALGGLANPWRNHSLHGDPVFAFARRLVASSLPGCGLPHDSPGCRRRCWRNASCSPPLCRSQKPRTCHPQRRPPLRLAYPQRRPAAPPAPHHNAAPPCPLAAPIYLLSSPRAAAQRWRTRSRVGQTRQLYCVMMSWHLQPHPRKRTCRAGGMTFQGNRPLQSSSWCDTIFRDGS